MMSDKDKLLVTLKDALTGILRGVWDQDADPALVSKYAQDIAEQKILATAAPTQEEKDKHNRNVAHLLVTIESIATARYQKAYSEGLNSFIGAVRAVINLIVQTALTS